MATMYEKIMDLPLFKGVGKDRISFFLEKTNVDFLNYERGEYIIKGGEDVSMLKFLISGTVKIVHSLDGLPIIVSEVCGNGIAFGADRLFGISTGYAYDVVALKKASVMQFSKEQYVNLLHSDHIYMLNFFNYLSLRAQRPIATLRDYSGGDLYSRLCLLVNIMTLTTSWDIEITATDGTLAEYGGMEISDVKAWKDRMERESKIKVNAGSIMIPSRQLFLAK